MAAPYLTPEVEKFLLDESAMKDVTDSAAVTAGLVDYDAIYLPGGEC